MTVQHHYYFVVFLLASLHHSTCWGWLTPYATGKNNPMRTRRSKTTALSFVPVTVAEEWLHLVRDPDEAPPVTLKDEYSFYKVEQTPQDRYDEQQEMLRRVIFEQSNIGGVDLVKPINKKQTAPLHSNVLVAPDGGFGLGHHTTWQVVRPDSTLVDKDPFGSNGFDIGYNSPNRLAP